MQLRKKIGRPQRRFWLRLDHADRKITFDLIGETVWASVDGRRFAASRIKDWLASPAGNTDQRLIGLHRLKSEADL
jgi:hypothetical protein